MHRRQGMKAYRDGPRMVANKQTNTPSNFALCSLCEERFSPRLTPNGCLGDQERSIREYNSALDYINSCHSIINHMMAQNRELKDFFVAMPTVPNFLDLFSVLLTHGFESRRKQQQQQQQQKAACEPHIIRSGNLRKANKLADDDPQRTSDSETSDFEMDVLQNAGKVPTMPRFKSKLPRAGDTIFEEDGADAAPAPPKRATSRSPKPAQRRSPPPSPQRVKRYSDIVAAPVQDVGRKAKPRSYSANAPRAKPTVAEKKSGQDLSANYSDTLLSATGTAKRQDLTQQELDKYAKELLGSGSGSPIHTPRSSSPDNRSGPTTDKSPTRMGRKSSKPTTPPTQGARRYSELLKRGYSGAQERQTLSPSESCIAKQPSLQKVTHTMEQTPPMALNQACPGQQTPQMQMQAPQMKRQKPAPGADQASAGNRPATPAAKMASQGASGYSVFAALQQAVKEKGANYCPGLGNEDNPYAMQEYMQTQMKKHEGARGKQGEQMAEDAYEQRKVNLRATPSKCNNQYGAKAKPKECFGSARKLSPADMKIIESQVQLFVEQHVESDEIKTDSDIEEDHTVKNKAADERPVRMAEDRQKGFRRKHSESDDDDHQQVGKFTEEHAYSTTADGYQRIHQSDEDAYDHRQRPVHVHRRGANYTYSHSGTRH